MVKRILIIAYFNGPKLGVGEVMDNLLTQFSKEKIQITVLTNNNTFDKLSLSDNSLPTVKIRWLNNSICGIFYFLFIFPFSNFYRRNEYNIFLANPIVSFFNKKCVSVIHDLNEFEVRDKYGKLRSAYRRLMLKIAIKYSNKIIVISEYVKEQINFHISQTCNNRISVIYNGIKKIPYVKNREVSDDFFLTVGRIDPIGKNLYELIDLFQILNIRNNYKLFLIGGINNSTKKEANDFLNYISKIPNVKYLGYVDELEKFEYYHSCKAAILLSKYEGFGLPLIEAYSCGCPVISNIENKVFNEIGGNLNHAINSNITQNADKIRISVNNYLNNINKEILKDYSNKFNWEHSAKEYLKVISKQS